MHLDFNIAAVFCRFCSRTAAKQSSLTEAALASQYSCTSAAVSLQQNCSSLRYHCTLTAIEAQCTAVHYESVYVLQYCAHIVGQAYCDRKHALRAVPSHSNCTRTMGHGIFRSAPAPPCSTTVPILYFFFKIN
jgi:hypothetical protein